MNSRNKNDSKKQTSISKKQKNSRFKKSNSPRQGKKRTTKNPKQNQKKPIPNKNPIKTSNQKKQEQKTTETDFFSKASKEDEWTLDNIDRYILAVRKAFEKIPETEKEEIDLREIWVNSSLPADLILKLISEHGERIGIKKNSLYLDGKKMY